MNERAWYSTNQVASTFAGPKSNRNEVEFDEAIDTG
jgi:hypothetical protein